MKTESNKKYCTIKNLSEVSGLPVSTINHYLNIDLLKETDRADNNYRLFSEKEVERLVKITELRIAGFSIDQIKRML